MKETGRPLKYETPDELEKAVDQYFNNNERITLSGLAVHLGFESRKTLYNYEKREGFLHIIKKARAKVEAQYEERLIYEPSPTGVIFALKNMGWGKKEEDNNMQEYAKMFAGAVQSLQSDRDEYKEPEAN